MLHETRQAQIASKIDAQPSPPASICGLQASNIKHQTSLSASIRTGPRSWAPKQTRSPKELNKQTGCSLAIHSDDTAIALPVSSSVAHCLYPPRHWPATPPS
ncbi:hypothetical protein HDV63DRAFT_375517 [Trichoderma sp. SZMC 28014]